MRGSPGSTLRATSSRRWMGFRSPMLHQFCGCLGRQSLLTGRWDHRRVTVEVFCAGSGVRGCAPEKTGLVAEGTPLTGREV